MQKGILVAWQGPGARHTDRAKTLGMRGLYIETADPPAAGAYIQLLVDTPEGEVSARAVVRNSDPDRGMGVGFVAMDRPPAPTFTASSSASSPEPRSNIRGDLP
ncbi:MAG: hypothetical protein ACYDCD_10185 [Candidatus Acidiferrales bacterium]